MSTSVVFVMLICIGEFTGQIQMLKYCVFSIPSLSRIILKTQGVAGKFI